MTKSAVTLEVLTRCGFGRVDDRCLDNSDRDLFLLRKEAVNLRLNGHTLKEIAVYTGISLSEITRLFKRFTTVGSDGEYLGEVALLPNKRIKAYARKALSYAKRSEQQGGLSGILTLTLRKNPEALSEFVEHVLQKGTQAYRGLNYKKSYYHTVLLNLLRKHGVTDNQWPFSTPGAGRRSILRLIDDILNGDFESSVFAMANVGGKAHLQVGNGVERLIYATAPFDVIEVDAYKVDGFFTLALNPEPNVTTSNVIDRFWLLAAIDNRSAAVLAHRLVFSSEVRAQDVLDLLCDASLGDWQPISDLSIPKLQYPPGAGMPGYLIEESKGVLWGSLFLDNAMAHHAGIISNNARTSLGFSINYGQLSRPERRSQIEGLFLQACKRFLHLIPSSTGSSPENGRSVSPIENAEKYQINVDEAAQVVDVFLASYNITPRRGRNYSLSPIEIMRQFFRESEYLFPRHQDRISAVTELSSRVKKCVVRGSIRKGIRPYIQLDKARYTTPELAGRPDLIGSSLRIKIDPQDYRVVVAYHESGELMGPLRAQGIWSHTKHSVTTRKLVNKAIDKKVIECSIIDDVIFKYREHLVKSKTRSANLELQRMIAEIEPSRAERNNTEAEPVRAEQPKVQSVSNNIGFDLVPGQLIPVSFNGQ